MPSGKVTNTSPGSLPRHYIHLGDTSTVFDLNFIFGVSAGPIPPTSGFFEPRSIGILHEETE